MDERQKMLVEAIGKCITARQAINNAGVRAHLPDDFFIDYDTGKPVPDVTVLAEIAAAYLLVPREPHTRMISETPDGHSLGLPPLEAELLPDDESQDESPGVAAAIQSEVGESKVSHGVGEPASSPKARLAAAKSAERDLLISLPALSRAVRDARATLATKVRNYQETGPQWSREHLVRDFLAQANKERAARANGEAWATRPGRERRGNIARVDAERAFSQGGDAATFARKLARTGNRRGAYAKDYYGSVNHDSSRGAVPKPEERKPTVPLLGK